MPKQDGRVLLPPCVEPVHYEIKLSPDLERFVFDGEENVTLDVREATAKLQFHTKELSVQSASVSFGGALLPAVSISYHLKDATCTVELDGEIPAGVEATLHLRFQGCLNNQMAGFYRSSYTAASGEKRVMASTQFEALDARRCFPCWDEPARKATFALTMEVARGLDCLSNMPEAESGVIEGGSKRVVRFMTTPKMSTYLLAICVGEFDYVSQVTEHGVLVRVYTPPGKSAQGTYALDVCCRCLDLYDDFFGTPYPLPKMDMIAIPEFAMGAMENWGLVTYRMVDLLIDPVSASPQQRQRVATVVNHELAHQWFGNLITMAWWDDLWLNEGFATWTETFANAQLFPDWKMWEQFTTDHQAAALRLDAMRTSHPIQVPIGRAEEVEEVFDAISYCKGSSVVRMAHAVIGHDAFKQGLQSYMKKHAYGNTETTDLWAAWQESSGMPVGEIMSSWTEQMGFPLLSVRSTATGVAVTQRWFLSDGSEPAEQKQWIVPLIYSTDGSGATSKVLMRGASEEIALPAGAAFFKLNAGQEVPLRVVYDDALLAKLRSAIAGGAMSVGDRAGVLMDYTALCKARMVPPAALVSLINAFRGELDATAWDALAGAFGLLSNAVVGEIGGAAAEEFSRWAASFITPAVKVVGWDASGGDGHLTKVCRGTLFALAAKYCHTDGTLVEEARRRFAVLVDVDASDEVKTAAVPAELKVPLMKLVLRAGGESEFDQLMALYASYDDNQKQKEVMNAIGNSGHAHLRQRVLEWAVGGTVKLQDFFYPIGSVSGVGKEATQQAWDFYKANFEHIKSMIATASPSIMSAVIVYSTRGFVSTEAADDIEAFFSDEAHKLPGSARRIAQLVENMRANAAFTGVVKAGIEELLGAMRA